MHIFDDRSLKELLSQTRDAAQALEGKTLEQESSEAIEQWKTQKLLEELWSLAAQGDAGALHKAIEVIEEKYSRELFNYVKMKIGEVDASDVTQEIYIEIFLHFVDRYNPEKGRVKQWLFGIARNLVLRWIRDNPGRREVLVEEDENTLAEVPSDEPLITDDLERREIYELVHKALREGGLNELEQDVISFIYLQDLGGEETAELVGLNSRQNVNYHRKNALGKLHVWFVARGFNLSDLT